MRPRLTAGLPLSAIDRRIVVHMLEPDRRRKRGLSSSPLPGVIADLFGAGTSSSFSPGWQASICRHSQTVILGDAGKHRRARRRSRHRTRACSGLCRRNLVADVQSGACFWPTSQTGLFFRRCKITQPQHTRQSSAEDYLRRITASAATGGLYRREALAGGLSPPTALGRGEGSSLTALCRRRLEAPPAIDAGKLRPPGYVLILLDGIDSIQSPRICSLAYGQFSAR